MNYERYDDIQQSVSFHAYWQEFSGFDAAAIRLAVLLNVAAAATEGAGLLLLLPLLALAGVLDKGGGHLSGRILYGLDVNWGFQGALLAFIALVALQSWLVLLRDRVSNSLQLRFVDHLRKSLYAALARARWSFFIERHNGDFFNVLASEVQRIGSGTYFLLRFFAMAILALAYLAVALWLSAGVTSMVLLTGLALWIILRGADGAARQKGLLLSQANRNIFTRIQDFLSSMKLVKIHGEEADSLQRFNHEVGEASGRMAEFNRIQTRVRATYRIGGAVALAVVVYVALAWFKLPAAHLLVMIAIFARMLPQLAELHGGRQQLLHMLPAFAAWSGLREACEAERAAHGSTGDAVSLAQGIAFERVDFRHVRSHHPLHIKRLFIPARQTTAIIGASGAGKTTLLDLLSGLLIPDSGMIRVDGVSLEQLPGWRRSIAYIPQETYIQSGSVRANLAWGNNVPQEDAMWRALEQAALAELVRRLPRGLDTEVGERGVKLSGGEKQRLALARALLRKPQLLILDEATSALDADNHRLILDSIRALHGRLSLLIVTHRYEELEGLIDGVVTVEDGVVGEWRKADGAA